MHAPEIFLSHCRFWSLPQSKNFIVIQMKQSGEFLADMCFTSIASRVCACLEKFSLQEVQ